MKKFISFGLKSFDPLKFKPVKNWPDILNGHHSKPLDGFWGCEFTPNKEYYSNWEEWVINTNFHQLSNPHSDPYLRNAITFQLSDTARIYTISSKEDYITLIKKYPRILKSPFPSRQYSYSIDGVYIDFEKVSQDFDAIIFSDPILVTSTLEVTLNDLEIQFPADYKTQEHYSINTNSLSIPSICIFNPDIITNIEHFINNHIQFDSELTAKLIYTLISQGNTPEQIITELTPQIQDDVELEKILQNVQHKIAQDLSKQAEYQRKLIEFLPLFVQFETLEKQALQPSTTSSDNPETSKIILDHLKLSLKIKMIYSDLYKIKTGLYTNSPEPNFIEQVKRDFRTILEEQLKQAQDNRNAALTQNQQLQSLNPQINQNI